ARPRHQHQRITKEFRGSKFALLGNIRDHAQVKLVVQEFAGYIPGKNAMDSNADARVESSIAIERRQQGVNRAFVRSDLDFAAFEAVQLLDSFADFLLEIQHSLGIFEQQDADIR